VFELTDKKGEHVKSKKILSLIRYIIRRSAKLLT